MALDDDIRTLSAVELFQGLTTEQVKLLAFGTELIRAEAGRELYLEGEPAETAFIIVSGRIRLFRIREGEIVMLDAFGPGVMLGELALIHETSRLTGAIPEVDTDLLRLSRKMFRRILEEYPDVAARLHGTLASRLHRLIADIAALEDRFA